MIKDNELNPTYYGLTGTDYEEVQKKLQKNKQFLDNTYLRNTTTNTIIPLRNGIISPYHSPERYYGSIQHRVNALTSYARENGLKPVFMTITLPSEYHPKKMKRGKLVNNPKYNGADPKVASKALTDRFAKIRQDRSLKDLPKDQRVYFRVTEPHKDGTPHLHVLMFVPSDRVEKLASAFDRLYRSEKHEKMANDIQLVETNIENSTAYIMKYINKVLPLSKKEKITLSDSFLNSWYSKYRIARFYSSRTLAPLELYKLLHNEYTLLELTYAKSNGSLAIYRDVETQKIMEVLREDEYLYIRDTNIELLSTLTASHSPDYAKPNLHEFYEMANPILELEPCG